MLGFMFFGFWVFKSRNGGGLFSSFKGRHDFGHSAGFQKDSEAVWWAKRIIRV
jgi:hypothetical protein